jgi:beta-glucosidase
MSVNDAWKDVNLPFEERCEILVSQMTLEEKISQMTYYSSALSRFSIPEYNWWNECLHGVGRAGSATMFPQPIGMAAGFDTQALYEIAGIIGDEARVKHHAAARMGDRGIYKGLTMWSPNINIFRDPRWGRGHETYGEDPFLTARMGTAFIKGLQGDDPKYFKCIATAKHYAVHSGPEADRHAFDAAVSPKDLTETYLPAFRAAHEEGRVYSFMGAYNRVNGEAACASPALLQDTLRGAWGFDGYVVSDCGAVEDIHEHHKLTETAAEAAALAVRNGCDLCCGSIYQHLTEAVQMGYLNEETISRAAYRLLLARFKLGLFDPEACQPYAHLPYALNDCREHHEKSLQIARDSMVLLKNDGLLPLDRNILKTIAVIGPNADSRDALKGNYCGTPSETFTVLEGLKQSAPDTRFLFAEGCALTGGSSEASWGETSSFRTAEALIAIEQADAAIIVTGLNGDREGEEGYGSGDRDTMLLPASQRALLDALATLHKPMVLVNMTGSATVFTHEDCFGAIIQAWYPGQMGGIAVADILFGDVNPSGRLPVTFYRDMEQVPDFRDYSMENRTYRFLRSEPAYPFGYGLSYTTFDYVGLEAAEDDNGVNLTVTVRNAGNRDGREVVQVYARWLSPAYRTPICQLAAFQPVFLKAGEARRVTLRVDGKQLAVISDEGYPVPHDGIIELCVGGGQPDTRTEALTGQKTLITKLHKSL